MSLYSFPQTFRRQLRYWAIHCMINALPSLAIALGWLGLWKSPGAISAMLAAIGSFILLYATLTSVQGPLSDQNHLLHRAMKLGAKIRAWISGISLVMVPLGTLTFFTPDFWCGWLSIMTLNFVERRFGTGGEFFTPSPGTATVDFWKVYTTTLLEGFILSVLLMMISFFCVIFVQSRDRRRAFAEGNPAGGLPR